MRRWLIVLALASAAGFVFAHGGRCGGGCGHKGGGHKGAGGCQQQQAQQKAQQKQCQQAQQQAQQKQVVRGNAQAPNTILQGIKHLKDLDKLLQQAANLLGSADPKLDKLLRKIAHILANIRNQFALPQVGVSFAVVKKVNKKALFAEDVWSFWVGGKGSVLFRKGKKPAKVKLDHARRAVFHLPPVKGPVLKGLADIVRKQLADLKKGDEVVILWFRLKKGGKIYIASVEKVVPPQQTQKHPNSGGKRGANKGNNKGKKGGGCQRP